MSRLDIDAIRSQMTLGMDIALGGVGRAEFIQKFGRNPSIGNAPETVWNYGGIYVYPTVAAPVYVSGSDEQDGAAGTGARTVTVLGLDANYNMIQETLTVDGAPSGSSFLRVYRAFVVTAGTLGANKGTVLISTGATGTGTVLADIGTIGSGTTYGTGQTFLGLYTVPAGYKGYLTRWNIGVGAYNDNCTALLGWKSPQGLFRTRDVMSVPGGLHNINYNVPLIFDEKVDIEIRALCSTGTEVSTNFDIILIKS